MINFKPWKDKIAVRPSKTEGVIVSPTGFDPTKGEVVAIGDDVTYYKVGDLILHGPKAGVWVEVDDEKFLVMHEFEPFGMLTAKDKTDVSDNESPS